MDCGDLEVGELCLSPSQDYTPGRSLTHKVIRSAVTRRTPSRPIRTAPCWSGTVSSAPGARSPRCVPSIPASRSPASAAGSWFRASSTHACLFPADPLHRRTGHAAAGLAGTVRPARGEQARRPGVRARSRSCHQSRRICNRKIREELISLRGKERTEGKTNHGTVQAANKQRSVNVKVFAAKQFAKVGKTAREEQEIENQRRNSALNRDLQIGHMHFVPAAGEWFVETDYISLPTKYHQFFICNFLSTVPAPPAMTVTTSHLASRRPTIEPPPLVHSPRAFLPKELHPQQDAVIGRATPIVLSFAALNTALMDVEIWSWSVSIMLLGSTCA